MAVARLVRRSLSAKILLVMASAFAITILIIAAFGFSTGYSIFTKAQDKLCQTACDYVADALQLESADEGHLRDRWSSVRVRLDAQELVRGIDVLALVDRDGAILTQHEGSALGAVADVAVIKTAIQEQRRAVHFDHSRLRVYVTRPMQEARYTSMLIHAATPAALYLEVDAIHHWTQFKQIFRDRAIIVGVSTAILVLVLYVFVHRALVRPIHTMTEQVETCIAEGFRAVPPMHHANADGDELARLGDAIHRMLVRIDYDHVENERQTREIFEQEERFRGLFENAVVGMHQTTLEGKYIAANKKLSAILGYNSPEELVDAGNGSMAGRYAEADRHEVFIRRIREHGSVQDFESRAKRRDGTPIWISETGSAVHNPKGEILYFEGTVIDITERRRIQDALERERAFREIIQNSIQSGVATIDRNARHTYVNPAFCRMLGMDAREVLDQTLPYEYWPEDLRPTYAKRLVSMINDMPSIRSYEMTLLRRSGESFCAEVLLSPLLEADGSASGLLAAVTDITTRKQAEEALRTSERRFRALIENGNDLIAIVDGDGRFQYLSPSFMRILGYELGDLLGRHAWELLGPEDRGHGPSFFDDLKQREPLTPVAFDVRFFASDNTWRELDAVGFNLLDEPAVAGLVFTARDVTERKQFESQLQHTQKLEGLGVLAGGIAHDFNNLLVGILGHASMVLLDLPENSPLRKEILSIERAAQRAADLCLQLLAYSGRGKFEVLPVNLTELVREMIHLLEVSISKNAALEYELEEDLPVFHGDATQVRQVIMNLITNASDALSDGLGLLTVRTGKKYCAKEDFEDAYIADGTVDGEYVFLEVRDTGCGMAPEIISRIFDPFFTTKFTGRGLGLASVLGIARGHRAAIKVQSELGQGTTFTVLFPSVEGAIALSQVDRTLQPMTSLRGKVLIVDDEQTVRDVTRLMLQRFGMTVIEARDGIEAIDIYRAQGDTIDLVLLDVTMPNMNGDETYQHLRELNPRIAVILCSGFTEVDTVESLGLEGLSGFLHKPYKIETLILKVREVLERGK